VDGRLLTLPNDFLGRPGCLWCYGHFGPPVVVFPSAAGFAHEWDRPGMFEVLGPLVRAGKVKFYCPESNVSQGWTDKESSIAARLEKHRAYESFILDTLVPFIREDCNWPTAPMTAVGCSLGGTYAALFALKYPETFRYALCLSGRYDVTWLTEGFSNADVYFNNPMAFLPNLEGDELERVRRNVHIVLVCGQGKWEDGNIEETNALAAILAAKGISHEKDLWGHDVAHEWTWWKRQARHHLVRGLAR
jgi:esterase/lipase superfamily enzyme